MDRVGDASMEEVAEEAPPVICELVHNIGGWVGGCGGAWQGWPVTMLAAGSRLLGAV